MDREELKSNANGGKKKMKGQAIQKGGYHWGYSIRHHRTGYLYFAQSWRSGFRGFPGSKGDRGSATGDQCLCGHRGKSTIQIADKREKSTQTKKRKMAWCDGRDYDLLFFGSVCLAFLYGIEMDLWNLKISCARCITKRRGLLYEISVVLLFYSCKKGEPFFPSSFFTTACRRVTSAYSFNW